MRFSIPLHPEMGTSVLTHLRRLVALPEHGFVAGQAVASALDDVYGKGGGVYNDVDVFIRAPRFTKPRARLVLLPSRFAAEISLEVPPGGDYGHLPLQHTVISAPTYTISGVRRRDLLNEVFYSTARTLGPLESARCVLTSFDINAVRVGVDIASGQLLWDVDFAQFARTGELRLCALHTPYHSLVRLLRKSRELPNVTTNVEASASLVAVLSTPEVRRSIEKHKAATFWFGAGYAKQARAVSSDLAAYFSLRTQHRYYDSIAGKVRPGFGDETDAPYELSTLTRRGQPDVACSPNVGSDILDMLKLPRQVYRRFENKAGRSVVVPAAPWQAKALELGPLAAQQASFGQGYLVEGQGVSLRQAKTLSKLLEPSAAIASQLQGLGASAQLELLEGVRGELRNAGVPDIEHVALYGASYAMVSDAASWLWGCEVRLKMERERQLAQLAVPTALGDSLWAEWPGAQVAVLATERQCREWCMAHGWEVPMFLSGFLWIGVNLGRHPRDTSMVRIAVDSGTRLLGQRNWLKKRVRMPRAMQADHKKLRILLIGYARSKGWFAAS